MRLTKLLCQIGKNIAKTRFKNKKSMEIIPALDRIASLTGKKFYISLNPEKRFLIRVDDYPRLDNKLDDFKKFHSITKKYNTDYLLCVTPFESFYGKSIDFANSEYFAYLLKEKIEFGLHGFTHQRIKGKSEILMMELQKLRNKLTETLKVFSKFPNFRRVFIPPFNHLDYRTYVELARHFKVITGGPETLHLFGAFPPIILNNCLYLPSYYGFYGRSERINNFLKSGATYFNNLMPITLHWAWERKDDFENLNYLLQNINGKTRAWEDFMGLFEIHVNIKRS